MTAAAFAATTEVPRGKRTPRRPATQVVVRRADLDAQGAVVHIAPGVGVVTSGSRVDEAWVGRGSGKVTVTLAGAAELTGRIDAASLGARLARTVPVGDPGGGPSGQGLEGALVVVRGRGAEKGTVVCETVGQVRARVVVPADALTADGRELVFPVVKERLVAATADTDLLVAPAGRVRARLERWARLAALGDEDGRWIRVRTAGAFALEGVVLKDRVGSVEDTPPLDETVPKGLLPTHEVLLEAPASADPAGRRPIGTLRGGMLLAVGIEVAGPRIRVMTYGDVVGEMWVPTAALRPLEREMWRDLGDGKGP